jgi:uncharacterized membrane protein
MVRSSSCFVGYYFNQYCMKTKPVFKKISLWLQTLLYSAAGINHFVNPDSYIAMIPPYVPFKTEVNIWVGVIELCLGLSLILFRKQRKLVVIGIIFLLIAVFPAHIYHLQMKGNIPGFDLVIPVWGAWVRIILQFVLIAWAWSIRKVS